MSPRAPSEKDSFSLVLVLVLVLVIGLIVAPLVASILLRVASEAVVAAWGNERESNVSSSRPLQPKSGVDHKFKPCCGKHKK